MFSKSPKNKNDQDKEKDEYHISFGFISNTKYILTMMHKYKKGLIVTTVIFALTTSASKYIWSIISKLGIDMVQSQAKSGVVDTVPLIKLILTATLILTIITVISTICGSKLWYNYIYVRMKLCQRRIEKTLTMNYEALENPKMLDRMYNANQATGGNNNGVEGMMQNLQRLMVSIFSFIMAATILSSLNLWLVLMIGIISLIQFYFYDKSVKKDKIFIWDEMAPISRRLHYMYRTGSDFSYAKDIRLFSMKDWLLSKLSIFHSEKYKLHLSSLNMWLRYDAFEKFMGMLRNGILYGYLAYSVLFQGISIGTFTLYLTSSFILSDTVLNFFKDLGTYGKVSAQTDDFRSFLAIPDMEKDKNNIPLPDTTSYEFTFLNVSFKYAEQDTYALKNLNLTIKAGERLAIVGFNGAGKTTMIKLLLRLYDVTEGCILLNGIDIRNFNRVSYFRLFAPVFQNVEIFAFPMSENVSMRPPLETDTNKAKDKLILAGMEDKLMTLDKGVHTELLKVLHDDGIDLSGGEKQKLALAKALYKDSPIVVLDEPTAALDALAECKLYMDFDSLIGNKTAIYISHRLASTKFCNRIAMFKDGKMIECGTHDELVAKDGAYSEMFKVQARYYK